MRSGTCMGLVFPNVHDNYMFEMTERRSLGSVPFAARYRLIDFPLSLLINAGIGKVGVMARENYRSLMDHLGTGKAWDLDRKNGGLFILPPFAYGEGTYTGHIDALYNAMSFIAHSVQPYVVLCNCDVVTNFPLDEMVKEHIASGADVTVAYKTGYLPENAEDRMVLKLDADRNVTDISIGLHTGDVCAHSLDIIVMAREKLIEMVRECTAHSRNSISRDILQANLGRLAIRGYEVDRFAEIIDGPNAYFRVSKELLDSREKRDQLFDPLRPVFTKTRDDMPTRYGLSSDVRGSLIGDGCIIEGTVRNSIIFRGVKIGKDAVVENCVIMQDSTVGNGASLCNVTLDKDVTVADGIALAGSPSYPMYIRKGLKV